MSSTAPIRVLALGLSIALPAAPQQPVAPRAPHWSLRPIADVIPPCAERPWPANGVDRFVLAALEAAGLAPSPDADRRTLVRRLYLDVHGLPPTPEQIEAFVGDPYPDAWARLVDAVLASPRYGERWARHWLDVARFAESDGFETNVERPNAYPYRDWVIEALNRDLGYDQFVTAQLAGDAIGVDAATGFLVGGPWDRVKSPDPELTAMQRQQELADMVGTTSTAFLGMTVGCARCHDHKFDPIPQRDFYAMQAVFAGVQHGERPLRRPTHEQDERRLAVIGERLAVVQHELTELAPEARVGHTIVLDDEDGAPHVTLLDPIAGHGTNPDGDGPGERRDRGTAARLPNISAGRYTWWKERRGVDLMAYRPGRAGRFRIWLSWGSGWDTHGRDVRYLLDLDGDLGTTDDQTAIAIVDQQRFAAGQNDASGGPPPGKPLWSGLCDAGTHALRAKSAIVLRGGDGVATTADVIVLQDAVVAGDLALPRLRSRVESRHNVDRFAPVLARAVRFTSFATNNAIEPCLDELEVHAAGDGRNVASGARLSSSGDYAGNPKHRLEHINDGRYGNDYSWISSTNDTGQVTLELAQPTRIDRVAWGRDRDGRYGDRTPVRYRIEVGLASGGWQTVASSEDRLPHHAPVSGASAALAAAMPAVSAARMRERIAEREALQAEVARLRPSQRAYVGRMVQPGPTHLLARGNPMAKREVVEPDALSALHRRVGELGLAADAPEPQRRLALARWITHASNPLTPRVIVNRIWQHHFGTGIVATPSDFGRNGAPPSHPQLLDWLARQLLEHGWSLKHVQRLILTSRSYRQSSAARPAAQARDAASRLLWRFPPRRLEAEAIRDAILVVSGALEPSMGGAGFSVFAPNGNYVRVYEPKEEFGPAEWRRMIYATKIRMEQDAVFGAFDCPDAGQPMSRRGRSTTAIQALNLFNSPFVLAQAQQFAARLEREPAPSVPARVRRAFHLAFGREPGAVERNGACRFVAQQGLPALCRALFNANEFLFLR